MEKKEPWSFEDMEDAIGELDRLRGSWGYRLLRDEIAQNVALETVRLESFGSEDRLLRQTQGAIRAFKLIVGDPVMDQDDLVSRMIADIKRKETEDYPNQL
nr:hypothetical protein [uncultured Rhodopila sp.]